MNDFMDDVQNKAEEAKDWAGDKVNDAQDWVDDTKDDFDKDRAHREGQVEGWAEAKEEELEDETNE